MTVLMLLMKFNLVEFNIVWGKKMHLELKVQLSHLQSKFTTVEI